MVTGHYGLGSILKRVEPEIPFGRLMIGVALSDILLGWALLFHREP